MDSNKTKGERYLKYVLIGLVLALLGLGIALGLVYRTFHRDKAIDFHQAWAAALEKRKTPLTANDVDVIRPWMTFDYINKLFGLPPDYFESDLLISNSHYPQITISGYAHYDHADTTSFLDQVKMALSNYLTNNSK